MMRSEQGAFQATSPLPSSHISLAPLRDREAPTSRHSARAIIFIGDRRPQAARRRTPAPNAYRAITMRAGAKMAAMPTDVMKFP